MYEKQDWSDVYGETPFNADRMKHIEEGIYENSQGNVYSTDEVFTGKYWIDGKKIYKKTYELANLTNGNNDITYDGSVIDTLVNVYGSILFLGTNGAGWQPIPRAFKDETFVISIGNIRDTLFRVTIGTNYDPAEKGYVILEYTKTTD